MSNKEAQKTVLRTIEDCEDLLEGAVWLGTGGGGSYQEGIELLTEVINEGRTIEWIDAENIPDDAWTFTIGLHGSIAPMSVEALDEIRAQNLVEADDEWYLVKAVKELGNALGRGFGCVVPAELGPDSVAIPLAVGARMGISVVNGDYIGRAVPEELQSTYCLYGKQSNLFAGVDMWGNSVFVKHAVNTYVLERMAKMLAVASYGNIAVATTPLIASEMKKIVVRGTLTRCLQIGKSLRESRTKGIDPIDATLDTAQAWRLFDGQVSSLETEDTGGYYYGTVEITGRGKNAEETLKVWFKNENHITWLNDKPWITSPDLITFLFTDSGKGIYNSNLQMGDEITVIGMKGVEGFRSAYGLSLGGPEHFGFDMDYTPIERFMSIE
jgi:DUF917 family protein